MDNIEPEIWKFIPAHEYARPGEPTRVAVRKGLLGALDHLRKPSKTQGDLNLSLELAAVPPYILDRAAAVPDWEALTPALSAALSTWADQPDQPPNIQLFIGAPHSGIPKVLASWAQSSDWRLVQSPSFDQIREGGQEWLASFRHNEAVPLVIPRLEHLFLRHHDGLALLQRTLDRLIHQEVHCLIGMNSWSWEYLCRTMRLNAFMPKPLTLAPCDFDHLKHWLPQLASKAEKLGFVFRQSDNGKLILPSTSAPGEPLTDYLSYLAAYSRGIPGVAWQIWRHSLLYEVDETVEEKAQASAEASAQRTMWVRTWSLLELPELAGILNQAQYFVLHTLLVHGGLGNNSLAHILPLDTDEVSQTVYELRTAGLIEFIDERWQVTAFAYPAVREALALEGFLVDAF